MSRSISFTDSYAMNSASVIPSVPRLFSALHASLIDSRSWIWLSVSARRPFCPGLAPGSIFDLSMYSSAACRCLSTRTAVDNLTRLEAEMSTPTLFDGGAA